MEWYILKSGAILAALLLFYKLLLEKENMHNFKRFYLLFAVVAAVGIPLITLTTYVEPTAGNFDPVLFHYSEEISVAESKSFSDYMPHVLWAIYAGGVIFFSFKFIRNLREILLKIKINPKIKKGIYTRVLLREQVDPHTFFSYIFFNRKKYEQEQIPREVIIHEEAHARQKHSLDILFVELLQIMFWMNPLIILLKDAVKLNHEFLADKAVVEKGVHTAGYQKTLLQFSSGHLHSDLVNPINYSSIKKRFKVMKTHTSKKAIWLRSILILPLISLLFFSFSNKEIVEREINVLPAETMNTTTLMLEVDNSGKFYFQKNETNLAELRKHINNGSYTSYHIEVAENAPSSIMIDLRQLMAQNRLAGSVALCTTKTAMQDKATPEMMAEYNRLVKYYNALQNANPEGEIQVKQEDINRIMAILGRMTPEQKENAEQIKFDVPPPPPPAPTPQPQSPPAPEKSSKNVDVPPAPPAPVMGNMQAPPPPPPSPMESVKDWIEEGAEFFYNGKKTTDQNVLEIVKKNGGKNLEVRVEENPTGKTVKISDKKSLNHNPPTSSRDGLKILPAPPVPSENKQPPPPPAPPKTSSSENLGFIYTAAQSPPSQNSNTLEYVIDLAKRGANFYIGPHKYSHEEAIRMVKKSTNEVSIDVSKYPDVILGGC
ncbi:peptidase M56 [Antarcticibacterium flavum]|uniref:Peptidase M56 n=1 Tax=Antarcticibacterium flavum TaxID=2058175 RepID=A0A5B7X5G6_9FLAO|nr:MULTISPECIES: M56 family metallopeptidase [Antarcticibacterium]MCM4159481.1 peptidase M56 [Antarcticibacterium sp. W02-3]QCY69883.1 peptidase M56 [Antarcticibacterium flavum]